MTAGRFLGWLLAVLLVANVAGFLAAAATGASDAALDFALGAVFAYAFLILVALVGVLK